MISYLPVDTVTAIFDNRSVLDYIKKEPSDSKICALNFASYQNPGGGFIIGANAQEENLCCESTLYNVLETQMESFYRPNRKRKNRGLYHDNLIYSPDIVFYRGEREVNADVITCAAPFTKTAKKYFNVTDEEVVSTLISRIDHVYNVAYANNVDTLILGAFGCGVFGNDLLDVATIFEILLRTKYDGCFEYVIFAVPIIHDNPVPYNTFCRVGRNMDEIYNPNNQQVETIDGMKKKAITFHGASYYKTMERELLLKSKVEAYLEQQQSTMKEE
jgi:uncharacterized protein (TIGR02452 family)